MRECFPSETVDTKVGGGRGRNPQQEGVTAAALSWPGLQCFPHFTPNVVENTAREKNLKWLCHPPEPSPPLPPSLSNAPLKAPEGFIPAQGGTEQNSSTPEVPSGPVCVTCVWPRPRQRLSGLSDGAPSAEHRRQAHPIADRFDFFFWGGGRGSSARCIQMQKYF